MTNLFYEFELWKEKNNYTEENDDDALWYKFVNGE